jgi:hypothetical protein
MRVREQSPEAVVAEKAVKAAGAKGRRTTERSYRSIYRGELRATRGTPGVTTTVATPCARRPEAVKPWRGRSGGREERTVRYSREKATHGKSDVTLVVSFLRPDKPPSPTAEYGKPYVRWCGRVTGRNPRHSTRSLRRELQDIPVPSGTGFSLWFRPSFRMERLHGAEESAPSRILYWNLRS